MVDLTHLSLFSGIGGLDLAAEWAGFRTVAFVERDKFCQRVLAKHWPGVPIFDDVAEVTTDSAHNGSCGRQIDSPRQVRGISEDKQGRNSNIRRGPFGFSRGSVHTVSGGFPCQPHSVAGKRQASADERDLWHEFARIIGDIRPRWVVAENVPGLFTSESGRFFSRVIGDLAAMGYAAGWCCYGADDVGALHRRDRVFIVAHANDVGLQIAKPESCEERTTGACQRTRIASDSGEVADANNESPQGRDMQQWAGRSAWTGREPIKGIWRTEPDVGRVATGVPKRVDRLKCLGNAVVPQQAYPIFNAIAEIERAYG